MTDLTEHPDRHPILARLFPWFAGAAVSAGLAMVTWRMSEASDKGAIDWVSYPAFTLLVIFIFAAYGWISRPHD